MLATFSGYIGAAVLSAAPFIIDSPLGKYAMILGLSLLTIQAIDKRLWNLVCLNLISIIGYCYAIYF